MLRLSNDNDIVGSLWGISARQRRFKSVLRMCKSAIYRGEKVSIFSRMRQSVRPLRMNQDKNFPASNRFRFGFAIIFRRKFDHLRRNFRTERVQKLTI